MVATHREGRRPQLVGRTALALAFAVAAWSFAVPGWSDAAESRPAGVGVSEPASEQVVVVGEGETLWDLAWPYAPAGVDRHAWVATVAAHNGVEPRQLRPGDTLRIPAG